MIKLNLDKTEFIIVGSHAQLKELDPYLPVRIFGNFMHPAFVVKNLNVLFDASFSFADHVCNICKKCFVQMCDLRWVRQYLSDEAAILVDTAILSSGVCIVSTNTNCDVFKTHLLGLSQTIAIHTGISYSQMTPMASS